MFKILVPLIAVALVAIFVLFKAVVLKPVTKPTSTVQTSADTSNGGFTQTPLTSTPSGSTSSLSSPSPTFAPSTVTEVNDARIRTIETAIIDLRVQVAALKGTSTLTTTTSSTSSPTPSPSNTKPPLYIPVGSGEQNIQSQDWVTIPGYEVTIDSGNYSGYKNMVLEASMRLNGQQGSSKVTARLVDLSNLSPVSGSDAPVITSEYHVGSSGNFTLSSGQKIYGLQLLSPDSTIAFIQFARIKVNY